MKSNYRKGTIARKTYGEEEDKKEKKVNADFVKYNSATTPMTPGFFNTCLLNDWLD